MNTRTPYPQIFNIVTIAMLLTACTTVQKTENPLRATTTRPVLPTATPLPTATATPTPTPSQIPTSTPEAQSLARTLGLPEERGYTYDSFDGQPVLIDSANQARRAIFDNSQGWRILDYHNLADAELMYGSLVPQKNTYLDGQELMKNVGGALYHFYRVKGIFLGDTETASVTYKNQPLEITYLLVGLRSADGVLHVLHFGADSADLEPAHYRTLSCQDADGNDRILIVDEDLEGVLRGLKVGARMKIDVLFGKNGYYPGVPKLYQNINVRLDNNVSSMMTMVLIRTKSADQITPEEGEALSKGQWPERIIKVYSIQPHTFEYMDCK
ncbi:MAG TPA: hypothetical protein VMT46_15080 [Anaerolineaceae bacterium]|nr:hypothetical protein [Anaerolineaceae bacterium]